MAWTRWKPFGCKSDWQFSQATGTHRVAAITAPIQYIALEVLATAIRPHKDTESWWLTLEITTDLDTVKSITFYYCVLHIWRDPALLFFFFISYLYLYPPPFFSILVPLHFLSLIFFCLIFVFFFLKNNWRYYFIEFYEMYINVIFVFQGERIMLIIREWFKKFEYFKTEGKEFCFFSSKSVKLQLLE